MDTGDLLILAGLGGIAVFVLAKKAGDAVFEPPPTSSVNVPDPTKTDRENVVQASYVAAGESLLGIEVVVDYLNAGAVPLTGEARVVAVLKDDEQGDFLGGSSDPSWTEKTRITIPSPRTGIGKTRVTFEHRDAKWRRPDYRLAFFFDDVQVGFANTDDVV
jgi:hypothetical protein